MRARYVVRTKADRDLNDQALYLATEASPEAGHRFLVSAHETFALLATSICRVLQATWHARARRHSKPSRWTTASGTRTRGWAISTSMTTGISWPPKHELFRAVILYPGRSEITRWFALAARLRHHDGEARHELESGAVATSASEVILTELGIMDYEAGATDSAWRSARLALAVDPR